MRAMGACEAFAAIRLTARRALQRRTLRPDARRCTALTLLCLRVQAKQALLEVLQKCLARRNLTFSGASTIPKRSFA